MAITLTTVIPPPPPGEAGVACAAGRWVTHQEWPGWRDACDQPGRYCFQPPYVLCWWHAWDLSERNQADAGEPA